MDTYISQLALDAYMRQAEVVEAACRDALANGGGVLLLRKPDGSIVVEVTEEVPDGQIHEVYDAPARYITGIAPDTPANERLTPKPLHEQVPGEWNFVEPKPRPPASGGATIQMVIDSHPERIQQETARLVEDEVRRRQSRRSRSW